MANSSLKMKKILICMAFSQHPSRLAHKTYLQRTTPSQSCDVISRYLTAIIADTVCSNTICRASTGNFPIMFIFPPPLDVSTQRAKGKRSSTPHTSREVKRVSRHYNPFSKQTHSFTYITYIGEANSDPTTLQPPPPSELYLPKLDPREQLNNHFGNKSSSKEWEKRNIFTADLNYTSPTGLVRTDLYVYAIDANGETQSQQTKSSYPRFLNKMQTPIERFYPRLWDSQHALNTGNPVKSLQQLESLPFYKKTYENVLRVDRIPVDKFQKVPLAIPEPIEPLHTSPPPQQHSLSPQASHLLQCFEPIDFFDAIFRPYEFNYILQKTLVYRQQLKKLTWNKPTYQEIRCFNGLLLWTSLVKMLNRRTYFTDSKIFHLPHFRAHTTRDRFQELFTMLHLANNNQITQTLKTAQRFQAKLGNLLTAVNKTSASLLTPARALSIDEMMVKFYGRSVLRHYIKANPHKYDIKLWAICCACCGYSLT